MATPSYTGPVGPCKLKVFPERHIEGVLGDLGAPVTTELGSQTPWRCQATVDFSIVPPAPWCAGGSLEVGDLGEGQEVRPRMGLVGKMFQHSYLSAMGQRWWP